MTKDQTIKYIKDLRTMLNMLKEDLGTVYNPYLLYKLAQHESTLLNLETRIKKNQVSQEELDRLGTEMIQLREQLVETADQYSPSTGADIIDADLAKEVVILKDLKYDEDEPLESPPPQNIKKATDYAENLKSTVTHKEYNPLTHILNKDKNLSDADFEKQKTQAKSLTNKVHNHVNMALEFLNQGDIKQYRQQMLKAFQARYQLVERIVEAMPNGEKKDQYRKDLKAQKIGDNEEYLAQPKHSDNTNPEKFLNARNENLTLLAGNVQDAIQNQTKPSKKLK